MDTNLLSEHLPHHQQHYHHPPHSRQHIRQGNKVSFICRTDGQTQRQKKNARTHDVVHRSRYNFLLKWQLKLFCREKKLCWFLFISRAYLSDTFWLKSCFFILFMFFSSLTSYALRLQGRQWTVRKWVRSFRCLSLDQCVFWIIWRFILFEGLILNAFGSCFKFSSWFKGIIYTCLYLEDCFVSYFLKLLSGYN